MIRLKHLSQPLSTKPYIFPHNATAPSGPGLSQCWDFVITLRHTTVGRTPLDEWSARSRYLYLTTLNTHNRYPWLVWDSRCMYCSNMRCYRLIWTRLQNCLLSSWETPTWRKHYRNLCNQCTTIRLLCDVLTEWELYCGTVAETFNLNFIWCRVLSGTSFNSLCVRNI